MATGYTTRARVLRITGNDVKLSGSLYMLGPSDENNGDIALAYSGITMNDDYKGMHRKFEFRFVNALDVTEYQLYQESDTDGSTDMIHIHTGSTGADEIITGLNGAVMVVAAAGWSGAAAVPVGSEYDLIELGTESNMTNNEIDDVINDCEAMIDERLRDESIIDVAETTIPAGLYFVLNAPVPRNITIATEYFAAYRIMDDMFRAGRMFNVRKGKSEDTDEALPFWGWMKRGANALASWIHSFNTQTGNAPRWYGAPPIITKVGVEGVAVAQDSLDGDYVIGEAAENDVLGIMDWFTGYAGIDNNFENLYLDT